MSINIAAANYQASQLRSYAERLQQAKNQLNSYRSSLAANWQGSEVSYVTQGIDMAVAQIDAVMRDLQNIANDVSNTAADIKREDDAAAAAARARAEQQQRIADAQTAYNAACDELDELNKARDELSKKAKGSLLERVPYEMKLEELEKKIQAAEEKCAACKSTLDAARR